MQLEEVLERDMGALRDRLRGMADLVLRQLDEAMTAFADSNRKLAYTVVLRDRRIDLFEDNIDRLCQEFLVRHMPVSEQLRFVVAVAKVNSELERIGDYAEAIARRVVTVSDESEVPQRDRIVEMSKVAFQMLGNAIDAFLENDAEKAMRTLESDRQVDDMNSAVFAALAQPKLSVTDLTMRFALLGLTNRIERVADRACNIAEETVYVARGEVMRHLPRNDLRVLFMCDHNACRSQMAEGIARKYSPSFFIFSSAGSEPTGLDERAVKFLAKKGVDISRQRPKGLEAVGKIDDFNIVVTLSQGAEDAVPALPYEAVELNWKIPDPSKATGTDEEVERAYDEAYQALRSKIEDVTAGLVGAQEREDEE